jgi:predicted permease
MFATARRQSILQDVQFSLRGFRRNPMFTLTALLAIALGIGACTAMFSVVDRILFRSLPYPDDSRLVSVGVTAPIEHQEFMLGRQYFDWKDHQTVFSSMSSWSGVGDCDITAENPLRLECARVAADFLPTFGIQPLIGRNFTAEEDRPGGPPVAIISYRLWHSRFAADPNIVGKSLPLDGVSRQIVGVLPSNFELPTLAAADVLIPQALDEAAQRSSPQGAVLQVFARLKPGLSIAQAETRLQPMFQDFLKSVPPQFRKEVRLRVRSLRDRQIHDERTASWILLFAVLAVLLISCANVASLLLARATSRRRETAVRVALGASRGRLVQLALCESVLIGLAGGVLGCLLGFLLLHALVALAPAGIPRLQQATVDARVLAFSFLLSVASGLVFGLAPALQTFRAEQLRSWHDSDIPRSHSRQILVALQTSICLVLLAGAGLLLRSLWQLEHQALGMEAEHVITAGITLNQHLYSNSEQQRQFFEQAEERLRQIPGVEQLALADSLPPEMSRFTLYASIRVEGQPPFAEGTGGQVAWRVVTPGYFAALGIPVVQGRDFREQDRKPAENSIVLSRSLAQRLFPGTDAIGKRIEVNAAPPWLTVIGIAGDVKNNGLQSGDIPEYYLARRHAPDFGLPDRFPPGSLRSASLIVRTPLAATTAAEWIRNAIHALDPTVPMEIATMDQRLMSEERRPRFDAVVLSLFAIIGLVLAAIGIYGVISFLVAQRTREIGVRMALGATPGRIIRLMLGQAARWILSGAAAGLVGSLLATQFLRSLLFNTSALDPWTFTAAMSLLLLIALAAAWIPSRRAALVDPLVALREE